MIKFKNISIKNFLSFGNVLQSFPLDGLGNALIMGQNKDIGESGESRNGVGKTTVMNAIVFALYGRGIESIKADQFINITNGKDLEVVLEFLIGEDKYTINRRRKPNKLTFDKNGESLTLDAMKNTDGLIEKIVGFDYDTFVLLYFLSPSKKSFMAMGGAEQRDMIEKLLSLDVLTQRASALKAIQSEMTTEKKLAQRDLENAEAQKNEVESQRERLLAKQKETNDALEEKKKKYDQTIKDTDGVDFDSLLHIIDSSIALKSEEQKIESDIELARERYLSMKKEKDRILDDVETGRDSIEKNKQWETTNKEAIEAAQEAMRSMPSIEDSKTTIDAFETYSTHMTEIEKIRSDISVEMGSLERCVIDMEACREKIESLKNGVCFNCGQYHVDEDALQKTNTQQEELDGRAESHEKNIEALQKRLDDLVGEDNDVCITKEQYAEALNNVKATESKKAELDRLKTSTTPYNNVPTEKNLSDLEKEATNINQNLTKIHARADEDKEKLVALKEEIEKTTKEVGNFTRDELVQLKNSRETALTGMKEVEETKNPYDDELTNLRSPNVDKFRHKLHDCDEDEKHCKYLKELLTSNKSFVRKRILDMYIPFMNKKIAEYSIGLGLPHIAKINNDMSVDIEYMGKNISYHNLSAGERLRLNIASTAAFKDLVTMLGKGSNLLLLDEILDSALDGDGMHSAFRLVKTIAENVIIISHREELQGKVDNLFYITKENGFSTIEKR